MLSSIFIKVFFGDYSKIIFLAFVYAGGAVNKTYNGSLETDDEHINDCMSAFTNGSHIWLTTNRPKKRFSHLLRCKFFAFIPPATVPMQSPLMDYAATS